MPTATNAPIVLTPANRCFSDVVTAQAATAGYSLGHATIFGHRGRGEGIGVIQQTCFTEPVEIAFDGDALLRAIGTPPDWRPLQATISFSRRTGEPMRGANLSGVQRLMGSVYEHAFVTYFQRNRADINARHGVVANWPAPIAFGRIVRNAFAHGGTIEIRDGNCGTWRGVAYGPADNGRQVLYNDLSSGDLTLLMLDMDESI